MNCEDVRTLMQPYIDGELDLTSSLEVEGHLDACADCGRAYRSQQALHAAFGANAPYYPAPAELRKRVQSAVRQEGKAAGSSHAASWSLLGIAAALALVAIILWGVTRSQSASSQNSLVAQEVLSSSMRSLIAGPLTDVQSSDQHTVKPWFAGKLDFSPSVQDFAAQGFALVGGRLDYLDGRPVAGLVYRHQQHVINLYTWPAAGGANAQVQEQNYQGYNVFHWTENGMAYWAVSDMDAGELRQFAHLVQRPPSLPTATATP